MSVTVKSYFQVKNLKRFISWSQLTQVLIIGASIPILAAEMTQVPEAAAAENSNIPRLAHDCEVAGEADLAVMGKIQWNCSLGSNTKAIFLAGCLIPSGNST